MPKIHVYTKAVDHTGPCPYCDQAKKWLAANEVPFTFEELTSLEREVVYDGLGLTGSDRTVPQILLTDDDGEVHRLGGFRELVASRVETLFQ